MFISPKEAYENGWITNLIDPEKQIGSDGIDLTIRTISQVNTEEPSILTSNKIYTHHRNLEYVEATVVGPNNYGLPEGLIGFELIKGTYDIEFNEYIKLPQGVAALLLLRSTFVRAGHSMFSGLYDQGFENFAGAVIHVEGPTFIESDMRTAQIVFVRSTGSGQLYAGGYNFKEGDVNWQDAAQRQGSTVQ